MLNLSLKSLGNRRFVALLAVFSIALSVALILGVERLRNEAREGFANSASGIDLIVAPRGNDVQILMATVFGVGSTGTGISWESYEMVEHLPQVSWAVPILMGDNHRGYPVIGTSADYFEHFRHSGGRQLMLRSGEVFEAPDGAVVGADVADAFGYAPGGEIINAHGSGEVAFDVHDEAPFTITGVLERTGTATDRMVFVSLEGFDSLHVDDVPGSSDPFETLATDRVARTGNNHSGHDADEEAAHILRHSQNQGTHEREERQIGTDDHHGEEETHLDAERSIDQHTSEEHAHKEHDGLAETQVDDAHDDHAHEPGTINAIYVGLTDRATVLSVQRSIAEYRGEALTAVLPNVALLQLWSLTDTAETALRLMAAAVAVAGMIGMVVMLSAALDVRRREFAILRSVGATPQNIFALILLEAGLLLMAGIVVGYFALMIATRFADPVLSESLGIRIGLGWPTYREALLIALIFCSGLCASLIPAYRVYRMTLADGLSMRL